MDGNGPAAKAKLRNGDVILRFNNQDVKEMRNLPRIVAETEINKDVPVEVWRDGKSQTLHVMVGELPDEQQAAATPEKPAPAPAKSVELAGLGLHLSPITAESREKFQLSAEQKGVLITDVDDGTPAGDKGLKPGDVIVEVQQKEVGTPAEVQERVEELRKTGRNSVLMLVQSGDGLRWVPLSVKADDKRKPG